MTLDSISPNDYDLVDEVRAGLCVKQAPGANNNRLGGRCLGRVEDDERKDPKNREE